MEKWTHALIGPQIGKIIIVTGGTDGIGLEVTRELARNGAFVIMGADDEIKGKRVERMLRSELGSQNVKYEYLNLADLSSVEAFVERIKNQYQQLHVLINNAGIAAVPERMLTVDGQEIIFAVNYLGHFALTVQLFELLRDTSDSRIIFQSSVEHKNAIMDFYDLEGHFKYDPVRAYAQSKLAMLLFAMELHRRANSAQLEVKVIPVHPGAVRTHIFDSGPDLSGKRARAKNMLEKFLIWAFGQSPSKGAYPSLFAATSAEAQSGVYYGPKGFWELRGRLDEANVAPQAKNLLAAEKLWDESERLTGLKFSVAPGNVLIFPEPPKEDYYPEFR